MKKTFFQTFYFLDTRISKNAIHFNHDALRMQDSRGAMRDATVIMTSNHKGNETASECGKIRSRGRWCGQKLISSSSFLLNYDSERKIAFSCTYYPMKPVTIKSCVVIYQISSLTEKWRELVSSIVQDGDLYGNSSLRRILQVSHDSFLSKRDNHCKMR